MPSTPCWMPSAARPWRQAREGHTDTDPWIPHISVAYSHGSGPAAPIIAALGRWLPTTEITMRSISLVAQTQVGRSWQWRETAELKLSGHA